MTALVSRLFIAMIPVKLRIFFTLVCLLFVTRMAMNFIFAGATPIN